MCGAEATEATWTEVNTGRALAILPGHAPQVIWACGGTSAARDSGKIAVSGGSPILRRALRQKHERYSPSS